MTYRWLLCCFVLAGLVMPAAVLAQDGDLPSVDPAACTIEPATITPGNDAGELNAVTPVPSPIVVDTTNPADPEVARAITERIAQAIACQNAGDLPRMIANFSSAWISERFSGYDLVFMLRFMAAAESQEPLAEADRIELLAIEEILVSEDGRAYATVLTRVHGAEQESVLEFVYENDHWLIERGQTSV